MGLEIITGDIFECSADALVFPASIFPKIYGLLDEQVYRKAGKQELLKAREKEGMLRVGRACITDSFGLKNQYKYLIHIPTPKFPKYFLGPGLPLPRFNYHYFLRICYTNALELIKENNLTSVVFPILGAGESGYPYKIAKDIGVMNLGSYRYSKINIILVEYRHQEQYRDFARTVRQAKEIEKNILPEWYINPNSVIGEHISFFNNIQKPEVNSKIDEIYSRYKEEKQELYEQMENKYPKMDKESIYQKVNDEIYKEIFKRNEKTIHKDLTEELNVNSDSDVSKLRNLISKNGYVYDAAYSFLKSRNNVIFLGKILELGIEDFCKLLWSRGHAFPLSDFEYDIIMSYIKEKEQQKNNYKEKSDR